MSHPLVVHCRRHRYDVYIGRGKCPLTGRYYGWGNTFEIGVDGTRAEVIAKHKAQLLLEMERNPKLKEAVMALRGQVLGCWCAPKACHGDTLAEIANQEKGTP